VSNYQSHSGQVTLTQPIWRHSNMIATSGARAAVIQSEQEIMAAEQDLLVRLTQAWLDLMLAKDAVRTAERQLSAARRLLDQTQKANDIELESLPKLEEVRAKFASAAADRIAASGEQQMKFSALAEILGDLDPLDPPALSEDYPLPTAGSRPLDEWLSAAESGPQVEASRIAVITAGNEIRKQRTAHEATLDLVGSYGRNYQEQGNFPGQDGYDVRQRSVGLQFTLPIYSGGAVSARIREAIALKNKAEQELSTTRRKARSTVQTAWFGLQTGYARYQASQQAQRAAEIAVRAAESGSSSGLKFELDVLDAKQKFYEARHDRETARYGIIMDAIKLQAVTGQLRDEDVKRLGDYLISAEESSNSSVTSTGRLDP
jgi:outer membrane protein